jgi:uncharacterized protein (DUF58 family)
MLVRRLDTCKETLGMKRIWVMLVLFAFAVAEALATGRRIFYNLAILTGGITAFSYLWTWYNVNWVNLERRTRSNRTQVGKIAEERFLLENKGILPKLWVEVRDYSDLPGYHASQVETSLGPKRRRGWTASTICRHRGRYTLGPVSLISGDPFGLFRRERRFDTTSTIVVYPLMVTLPHFALPVGMLQGRGSMRRRTHYITPNVASIRDYYPGDSLNRIHWPSTARHSRLLVKEFELDPTADIWLFLDMHSPVQASELAEGDEGADTEPLVRFWTGAGTGLDPSTEEYGVAIAASLAQHFIAQERSVGLVTYGQHREVIQSDRGERQLTKILETLAVIRAKGRMPLAQVLTAEGGRLSKNVSIVAITPSTDQEWIGSLRGLRRRGVYGVAVLVDKQTFGGEESARTMSSALADSGIPSYVVRKGDALGEALTAPKGAPW